MDVFVFLFRSVDFLLLFLLASVQIGSHVDIGILDHSLEVLFVQMSTLIDKAALS